MTAPAANYAGIVERYIQLRDEVNRIEAENKATLAPYKEAMSKIESYLLDHLNKGQADSVATPAGTFFKTERTSATVADWDLTLPFVREHKLWSMLDKRINKTAVKEYIEAHGEPPPGVNWSRALVCQIRRS